MSYTKEAKPKIADYLKREQNDYILLENGGKIIIRRAWTAEAKPTAPATGEAKPTATWSKEAKPAIP